MPIEESTSWRNEVDLCTFFRRYRLCHSGLPTGAGNIRKSAECLMPGIVWKLRFAAKLTENVNTQMAERRQSRWIIRYTMLRMKVLRRGQTSGYAVVFMNYWRILWRYRSRWSTDKISGSLTTNAGSEELDTEKNFKVNPKVDSVGPPPIIDGWRMNSSPIPVLTNE